jgi:AraC-like DNA-binding protein
VVYGPTAEHTARNLPELDFMFAVADRHQLEDHAAQLGIRIETPPRGEVRELARTPRTDLVGGAFTRFVGLAATGVYPSSAHADDVLRATAHALSEQDVVRRIGCSNRIDSCRVVHACIEHAELIGRIPSITELCLVAYVSERRLREAIVQEYGLPPSRFFRAWALNEAHRRLLHAETDYQTVTEVATGLGFGHLGRFSLRYRDVYGENPSTTLDISARRPSIA